MGRYLIIFLVFTVSFATAQNHENVFHRIWNDNTWALGALTPSGPVWSLHGGIDRNGNNNKAFLYSSSWSGSYGNDVGLYEYNGSGYELVWYYWFSGLDLNEDNYSQATTGDLDGDGIAEIIVMNDCAAGQSCLYIFEYDAALGNFPETPTATWDLNISGGVDEVCTLKVTDADGDGQNELITFLHTETPYEARLMVVQLQAGSDLAQPVWQTELDDNTTFSYYGYLAETFDLDNDGQTEIVVVEWNYTRMVIYENRGPDSWEQVNDFYLTWEASAFSNQGAAAADMDGDGLQELYLASTAGYLWMVTNNGDVSQMNYLDNAHLIKDFRSEGGFVPTQVQIGNADSPVNGNADGMDIYVATTDSMGLKSVLYDFEFTGSDAADPAAYTEYTIYSSAGGAEELYKIAKFDIAEQDGDGNSEIITSSFGLGVDVSHFLVLRRGSVSQLEDMNPAAESGFHLSGNYPNPFNPATQIGFEIDRPMPVTLDVYNSAGMHVARLLNGEMQVTGSHRVQFDGSGLASGIYFYQISVPGAQFTGKMLLLR
jgi:hypothetical protein